MGDNTSIFVMLFVLRQNFFPHALRDLNKKKTNLIVHFQ